MYFFFDFIVLVLIVILLIQVGRLKDKIDSLAEIVRAMKRGFEKPHEKSEEESPEKAPWEALKEEVKSSTAYGEAPPWSSAYTPAAGTDYAGQPNGPNMEPHLAYNMAPNVPNEALPREEPAAFPFPPPPFAGNYAFTGAPHTEQPNNYAPAPDTSAPDTSAFDTSAFDTSTFDTSTFDTSAYADYSGYSGPSQELKENGEAEKNSIAIAFAKFVKGGYAWVAAGVIFMLVAFSLLITYLAQHNIFTVEMRIASAAIVGLVMVAIGWRLRLVKPAYALIVQGGGIGLVYLAVFSAAKFSNLIPIPVALVLISCLIPPTIIMAVAQRSQPLAIFAFLGGFAAPILLSTGSNNYIALFSYYTILNIGILVLARMRPWRGTGFLAFACTFAVAFVWLNTKFDAQTPLHTVIPFWWIFTLIFTLLPIVYSQHEKGKNISLADTIMALGTPFLGLHLHHFVLNVHFSETPSAFSLSTYKLAAIFAFAAFYLLFASILNKKFGEKMRLITESMLASSVCIVLLGIFLKLSGSVDIATFVTLAAIIFCFAIRKRRASIAIAALIVYLAYVPFIFFSYGSYSDYYPVSIKFTNFLIMALLAFLMGIICCKNSSPKGTTANIGGNMGANADALPFTAEFEADYHPSRRERIAEATYSNWGLCLPFGKILIITGFIWWIAAWYQKDILVFGDPSSTANLALFISPLLFYVISKKTNITVFTWFTLLMLLLGAGKVVLSLPLLNMRYYADDYNFYAYNFFDTPINAIMWLAFFGCQYFLLAAERKRMDLHALSKTLNNYLHAAWLFILVLTTTLVTTFTLRAYADHFLLASSWTTLAGVLPTLAFAVVLAHMGRKNAALPAPHRWTMLLFLPVLLWGSVAIWFLHTLGVPGDPSPLSLYLPLLNPIELQQAFCIVILAIWQVEARRDGHIPALSKKALLTLIDIMAFLWLNSMLARAYHFYADVPMGEVFAESGYQLGLLILWGVYGISHMIIANRLGARRAWIAGAILTVIDIAKLLLVDMAHSDTIPKIVAFFVAGIFLMLVGWFAPLPSSSKQKKTNNDTSLNNKNEAQNEI